MLRLSMAATTYSTARNIYEYANCDGLRIAGVKAAFDFAVENGPMIKGGLDTITGAGKNAMNMTKQVGLDEGSRIDALRLALIWLRQGFATSTRSRGIF